MRAYAGEISARWRVKRTWPIVEIMFPCCYRNIDNDSLISLGAARIARIGFAW